MSSNVFPVAPESISWRRQRHIPETPMQAIQEADIFEEPVEDMMTKTLRLEPVRAAIEDPEVLTDRERWVVEAYFWRGRSYSQIAGELGMAKTSIHRIMQVAFGKLGDHLEAVGAAPDGEPT